MTGGNQLHRKDRGNIPGRRSQVKGEASAEWEEGAAGVEVTWTSRDLWGPPGPGKGKSLGSYSGYNVKTLEGFKQEVL